MNEDINNTIENETSASQEEVQNTTLLSDTDIKKLKKKARRQGVLIGCIIAFFVFGGLTVYAIARSNYNYYDKYISFKSGKDDLLGKKNYNKVNKLNELIKETFLFDYDNDALVDGMYKGLFEALGDEYSYYYNKEEYEDYMNGSNGTFEGIGAYLQLDEDAGLVKVVRPIANSPAEKIGVLKDDYIFEVDGENMEGKDADYVASKVRGPKGTTVHIKFKRGDEFVEYDIERHTIHEDSVTSEVKEDNIGYMYISTFDDDTNVEFENNLKTLTDQNITSLIIDLRSNGGGYVDVAVDIADQILDKGTVVTIENKKGQKYEYKSDAERKLDIPIVVLIDEYTASASEILTGALRDYDVATIVGVKSFGKGIVQDIISLDDGSGVKLTSAQYFTPNGECIHKKGIEPDILVEFDSDEYIKTKVDNQLAKAIEIAKSKTK